jgi:tetratricopeptide (TPR) repeat protein
VWLGYRKLISPDSVSNMSAHRLSYQAARPLAPSLAADGWSLRAIFFGALLPVFFAGCQSSAPAQTGPAGSSSQVQQLYAEAHAAQSRGDTDTAVDRYQQILKLAPRLAAAYNNLGLIYYQKHDLQQAVDTFEKALRLDPAASGTSALLGTAQFDMGEYQKARLHLEAAVHANAKDSFARRMLARDLIALKDYEAAVTQLRTLVAQDPKDQDAWYQLGKAHMQLSEHALAKVSEIDPSSALSQEIAGEIMQGMGNSDGALTAFKKAVEIAPDQPGTHQHLADEFWTMGKWESARDEFQAELKNDPNNCQVRWKAADCLIGMHGSPEQELNELNTVVSQCPGLMQARVDRARALIELNRSDAAIPDLLMAKENSPDEPSIHFYLANAYRAQGRADAAHGELQTYKRLLESASDAESRRAVEAENIKKNAH